jgi:transposase
VTYAAMDVHRKRSRIAVVDDDGAEVVNKSVANRPEQLMPVLGSLAPGTSVAFEAAYGWGWLADLLDELGLEAHMAHPLRCKAIASARLKNDKVDARTLAHLLRADLLPEAWIAPKEVRELRMLLRHRARLVRARSAFKTRIHSVLADCAIPGDGLDLRTASGHAVVESLELTDIARRIVSDCLTAIDSLQPLIASLEKDIRARAEPDGRVDALRCIYGVGLYTAMTLVSEIGDISRFPTARKLCAWAGLTPNVRNSADKVRHGRITKQGSPWVRWVLTEAAHVAKGKPPYVSDYARIAKRRGKNIATVAIARKLLARSFWILKDAS